MGKKKIQIRKITNERKRFVTFHKRKAGVIKKAMELSILCGVEVALVVFDPTTNEIDVYSSDDLTKTVYRLHGRPRSIILDNSQYEKLFGSDGGKDIDDDDGETDEVIADSLQPSSSASGSASITNETPLSALPTDTPLSNAQLATAIQDSSRASQASQPAVMDNDLMQHLQALQSLLQNPRAADIVRLLGTMVANRNESSTSMPSSTMATTTATTTTDASWSQQTTTSSGSSKTPRPSLSVTIPPTTLPPVPVAKTTNSPAQTPTKPDTPSSFLQISPVGQGSISPDGAFSLTSGFLDTEFSTPKSKDSSDSSSSTRKVPSFPLIASPFASPDPILQSPVTPTSFPFGALPTTPTSNPELLPNMAQPSPALFTPNSAPPYPFLPTPK